MARITKDIVINVDTDGIEEAQRAFGGVSDEVKDVNSELRRLQRQIEQSSNPQEVEQLTKEYKGLEKELNKVEKEYKDVEKAQDKASESAGNFAEKNVETAENAFKVGEGLVGVFTLVSLASSESQEDTEALLAEVLQLVVVLDAVKKTAEGFRGAFRIAQTAAKNFSRGTKRALAASGIGLLVVAIGAIVVAFDSLGEAAENSTDQASEGFSNLRDVIDSIKAGFEVLKNVVLENAVAFVRGLLPLTAYINFLSDFIGNLREGKGVVTSFGDAFEEARIRAEEAINGIRDSIDGIGDDYEEELEKIKLQRVIEELQEASKLTNGLATSNASLLKAQAGATDNLEKRIALEKQAINIQLGAINQELSLFPKILGLRELTTDELIRQNDLRNQAQTLLIERASLEQQLREEEAKANQEAFDNERSRIERLAEFRKKVIETEVSDANQQASEILGIEEERISATISLFQSESDRIKELGDNATKEEIERRKELNDEILSLQLDLQQNLNAQQEDFIAQRQRLDAEELANFEASIAEQQKVFQRGLAENKFNLDERSRDLRIARNNDLITEEEFAEKSLQIQADALQREIELRRANGEDALSLESQLLDLRKQQADKENEDRKAQNEELINQTRELFTQLSELAFSLQEAQIARIDSLLETNQAKIDALNETLSATEERGNQIDEDVKNSQDRLRETNQANADEIKEQLNAQRIERAKNIELAKQQQKQVEQAEQEQAKLEEEKAEREKRLAKQQSQVALALALVETAPALVKALQLPFPASLASFATISALIGTTIAKSVQASQSFRDGGLLSGNSHEQGGIRGTGAFGDVEVEGGEYIVNKRDTARNLPLLEAINNGKRVFQNGGQLTPTAEANAQATATNDISAIAEAVAKIQPVVSVQDINAGQTRVNVIEQSTEI